MLYLGLSIICSVLLGFIFKLYSRFQVDSFQAIVFNYFTCVICGWIYSGSLPIGPDMGDEGRWLPYAIGLGAVFISGFTGAALTVRYFGVTISQIMQKMSILMTVPFAILMYHESAGLLKITGVFMALVAIILVNWPQRSTLLEPAVKKGPIWLPLITWLLASVIEIVFLWVQGEKYVAPDNVRFISTIFCTAGVLGLAIATYGWIAQTRVWSWRNVAGGIILGVPNFGSMYFLLLALGTGLEGSFVFPVINVGIILTTTVGAVFLFQERLSRINWIGFVFAIAAILAMSFF